MGVEMALVDRPAISIVSADGVRLALYCVPMNVPTATTAEVILTHGTFSNARVCLALAGYLASIGFRCWVLDWRGHGESGAAPRQTTFDSVAQLDVPAVLQAVLERVGSRPVFWLGHSGGGLLGAMWAARNAALAHTRLRGLLMLGSQATLAGARLHNRLLIRCIDFLISAIRSAPGHYLGVGPEPENPQMMRQWCRWNIEGKFSGDDRFDYSAALKRLQIPVLALSGAGDTFIAPSDGCRRLAYAFGGADITFHECGVATGFAENYTHDRLILSKPARREIWPLLASWMQERLQPLSVAT
ncbi:MAG: alpha/beta fold hydrolase [Syntrophobacteraceae bacterium]